MSLNGQQNRAAYLAVEEAMRDYEALEWGKERLFAIRIYNYWPIKGGEFKGLFAEPLLFRENRFLMQSLRDYLVTICCRNGYASVLLAIPTNATFAVIIVHKLHEPFCSQPRTQYVCPQMMAAVLIECLHCKKALYSLTVGIIYGFAIITRNDLGGSCVILSPYSSSAPSIVYLYLSVAAAAARSRKSDSSSPKLQVLLPLFGVCAPAWRLETDRDAKDVQSEKL